MQTSSKTKNKTKALFFVALEASQDQDLKDLQWRI